MNYIFLPPTKAAPIAANKTGFMSFTTNIFRSIITIPTKSEINPSMLVALTALNQSEIKTSSNKQVEKLSKCIINIYLMSTQYLFFT